MRCSSQNSNHKYENFPPKIQNIPINFNYYFSKKFRALRYPVKMRSYKAVGDGSTIFEELATLSGLAPWRVGTGHWAMRQMLPFGRHVTSTRRSRVSQKLAARVCTQQAMRMDPGGVASLFVVCRELRGQGRQTRQALLSTLPSR